MDTIDMIRPLLGYWQAVRDGDTISNKKLRLLTMRLELYPYHALCALTRFLRKRDDWPDDVTPRVLSKLKALHKQQRLAEQGLHGPTERDLMHTRENLRLITIFMLAALAACADAPRFHSKVKGTDRTTLLEALDTIGDPSHGVMAIIGRSATALHKHAAVFLTPTIPREEGWTLAHGV